jgi:hypothetical protein
MKSFLITNLCDKTRVKTKDGVMLKVFSAFYSHPAMVNEEAWHLIEAHDNKVLVDEDTAVIMKDMILEFGQEAISDTILTCKLTSSIEGEDERAIQWNEKYKHAMDVRLNMAKFYDKKKVDELTETLAGITVSAKIGSDSVDNSVTPGSIREEQE